eukprot:2212314-Pleurochrysis_carterae.AAC.1
MRFAGKNEAAGKRERQRRAGSCRVELCVVVVGHGTPNDNIRRLERKEVQPKRNFLTSAASIVYT